MGQKVNPHGARVGVIYDWSTRWYAGKKDFANNLVEDYKLRKMLKEKYYSTGISHIDIERTHRGTEAEHHRVPGPSLPHQCDGDQAARRGRAAGCREHRAAAREAHQLPPGHEAGAAAQHEDSRSQGNQDERERPPGRRGHRPQRTLPIARSEHYHEGSIPLQTLRANIDYGFAEAKTTYGRLGIKVWIYKGQILPRAKKAPAGKEGK